LAYWWDSVFPYPVMSNPDDGSIRYLHRSARSGRGGRRGRPHLRDAGAFHAGFSVTDVEDGQQALQALEVERFDLLVADIVMPVVDGIALALSASNSEPDLRILLITGYPAEHKRARNLDALIHGVIPKPFSLQELCAAAKAALGR
jgi:two-component system, cell cycle response regulator CpdR